jgi:ferredoxin
VQITRGYKVEFEMLNGTKQELELQEGETMLEAMLEAGMEPTYDCKMGVCMTCPARIVRSDLLP